MNWTRTTVFLTALLLILPGLGMAMDFDIRGAGTVTRVIDGDTLIVEVSDHGSFNALYQEARKAQQNTRRDLNLNQNYRTNRQSFRIRVGNIDTAESKHPDASQNSREGDVAAEYAKRLLARQPVNFVCWEIGYYGRAICSVIHEQFEFGTEMIRQGFADYETGYGRHPHWHEQYREAAQN